MFRFLLKLLKPLAIILLLAYMLAATAVIRNLPHDEVTFTASRDVPYRTKENNECIIAIHGAFSRGKSFFKMGQYFKNRGYKVLRVNYAWNRYTLDELVTYTQKLARIECKDKTTHYVTQSLGGIVLRQMLEQEPPTPLGRVIMLSPVNQGSELVQWLGWIPGAKKALGPAVFAMDTALDDETSTNYDVGLIAGVVSSNLIFSAILPGADDGLVSVANAQWTQAKDITYQPLPYGILPGDEATVNQIEYFIKNGEFKKD